MNHDSRNAVKPDFVIWVLVILAFLSGTHPGLAQGSGLSDKIQQHYSKGSELMQAGDLQGAETELNQVTLLAPQIPEPYYLLAKISMATGRLEGAESEESICSVRTTYGLGKLSKKPYV
jgi:Tfp pilus assembly protein PilF